jgi:hypothetical protein
MLMDTNLHGPFFTTPSMYVKNKGQIAEANFAIATGQTIY